MTYAALLHGGEQDADARWSFIAAFPSSILEIREDAAFLNGRRSQVSPFDALRALHSARRIARAREPGAPPFASGLCGYAGYEMGAIIEPTAKGRASPFRLPDGAFGAYDAVAAFDRRRRRALVSGVDSRGIDRLIEALGRQPVCVEPPRGFSQARSNFNAEDYRRAVAKAIARIREGDFFQVNLSQRLETGTESKTSAYDVFMQLAKGDSPFAAFLKQDCAAILSNSPERFFAVLHEGDGFKVVAEPIKGTRPRGRTSEEDARFAEDLVRSVKDRAENIMIADLTRNDLSRVCKDGSIREEAICTLVSRTGVHHLASRISGMLKDGLTPIDVLAAMFPCGSITGAPKIEAMRAIAELEDSGRGPYCGAIGYIDDGGVADFSVAIRTLVAEPLGRGLKMSFSVGGGITLRSDPEEERAETMTKARTAFAALGIEEPAA